MALVALRPWSADLLGAVLAITWVLVPGLAAAQAADPLEGLPVREIRVAGVRHLPPDTIERHLQTRRGQPFHRATLDLDRRRLDELRLFASIVIEPTRDQDAVILEVTVSETLRLLPAAVVRVTDENGLSAGPAMKGINLLGHGIQIGAAVLLGGETTVSATADVTTITPGTWAWHAGFSDSRRYNTLHDFDEHATTGDVRLSRNWRHGLRWGALANLQAFDTGTSGESLSPDGRDVIPTLGGFVTFDSLDSSTNPRTGTWAEIEVDRLFGDARSSTVLLDGRSFHRLSDRHGLGLFSLAAFQTGEPGVSLPDYLLFALGGGNSVRGWSLGSRSGRNQSISTVEYTFTTVPVRAFSVSGVHLYAGLQIAGFADLGLAWNNHSDFRAASAIDGYGMGLRIQVPFVDLLRVDVAWGEPGRGATAYFGVSLKANRQRQRVR